MNLDSAIEPVNNLGRQRNSVTNDERKTTRQKRKPAPPPSVTVSHRSEIDLGNGTLRSEFNLEVLGKIEVKDIGDQIARKRLN